jgi:peptidoglycan/xylan/chitin deacetylase (PgdA/CDA1 family)
MLMSVSKFRLDRALSVGLVHPAARLLYGHRLSRIPILMYHGIRRGVGTNHPYFETNTSPEVFANHMRFLHQGGYATVDLGDAIDGIQAARNLQKCVVITFDDGYRDFYTHAFPILEEYGFKATMFIVSALTQEHRCLRDQEEFLTWDEVREVHAAGMRIGSHTLTHPELHSMRPSQIEDEIRRSKHVIEGKLGVAIQSFAYPFAFPEQDRTFVMMLRELLEKHGYRNGVSTIIGTAQPSHDVFFLPRLPVNSYDDLRFLEAKLNGGYDWLHPLQYARKRVKPVM